MSMRSGGSGMEMNIGDRPSCSCAPARRAETSRRALLRPRRTEHGQVVLAESVRTVRPPQLQAHTFPELGRIDPDGIGDEERPLLELERDDSVGGGYSSK